MYMCFPCSYVFDGKPPEMKSEEVSACFMHVVFNSDCHACNKWFVKLFIYIVAAVVN